MSDTATNGDVTNPEKTPAQDGAANQAGSQETQTQAAPVQKPESQSVREFRALMDLERTLRQRETALEQQSREIEQYKSLSQVAKEKPLEALRTMGIDFEDLVKRVGKGERPDPVDPLRQEMQQIKQRLEEMQRREEADERATATQRAQQGVREYVGSSEEYPLTKHLDAADMVFDYVQNHYNTTGEWLSEADAASEVEAYLSGLVDKALELEHVRSKLSGQSAKPAETPHISNQTASEVQSRRSEETMSMEDKLAAAARKWAEGVGGV